MVSNESSCGWKCGGAHHPRTELAAYYPALVEVLIKGVVLKGCAGAT